MKIVIVDDSGKTLPIMMMFSNLSSPSYKEKTLKAKAEYFFNKTYDFKELIVTIESLIKNDRIKQ